IVLPLTFPLEDSRILRFSVARGNMAYSAEIQPLFCPLKKGGTRFSMLALQMTFVPPASISTDPSGCLIYPVVIVTFRICCFSIIPTPFFFISLLFQCSFSLVEQFLH